jgi:hypothetical protein
VEYQLRHSVLILELTINRGLSNEDLDHKHLKTNLGMMKGPTYIKYVKAYKSYQEIGNLLIAEMKSAKLEIAYKLSLTIYHLTTVTSLRT